jgi:hypothetical protein
MGLLERALRKLGGMLSRRNCRFMILMYDHWSEGFGGSAPLWVCLLDCEDGH